MADAPFNPPRTRVRRHLEEAERDAGIAGVPAGDKSVPGAAASPTDSKTGIGFFKGRKATSAQSDAKKKALVSKLRDTKPDFAASGFGKVDASDSDGEEDN